MTKLFLTFILCIALIGCSTDSEDKSINSQPEVSTEQTTSSQITESEQEAFDVLFETGEFASTAVGFAGSAPRQVPAFQEVLNSELAVDLFTELQENATLAGQLYGLCGLYLVDKEHFNEVISGYQNNPNKVQTFFGCELGDTPLADVIPSIVDGYYPEAYKNCKTE